MRERPSWLHPSCVIVPEPFVDTNKLLGLVGEARIKGMGYTRKQLDAAPEGAFFVWCIEDTRYPRELAWMLGRPDIQIKPASWWRGGSQSGFNAHYSLRGRRGAHIVIDHAYKDQENDHIFYPV